MGVLMINYVAFGSWGASLSIDSSGSNTRLQVPSSQRRLSRYNNLPLFILSFASVNTFYIVSQKKLHSLCDQGSEAKDPYLAPIRSSVIIYPCAPTSRTWLALRRVRRYPAIGKWTAKCETCVPRV